MKTVILSFDYELFFGIHSGTVDKTLIAPTNKLMDAMEVEGFYGNFFIDYLMIKYLKQEKDKQAVDDLAKIEAQLKDMVKRGHRIELHLHPHWIDAKYNGDGTWNYNNYSHYSLNSLDAATIMQMFIDGTEYLNNLAHEIDSKYKVCAFRAGGWAVQPFEALKKAFIKTGIIVDSSSAFGIYSFLPVSYYDFRNMPQKPYYNFEDDVCKEVGDGSYIEVPITTFRRTLFNAFTYKLNQFIHSGYNTRITDGTHVRNDLPRMSKVEHLFNFLFPGRVASMFSFSMNNPINLRSTMERTKHDFYCFIDHPKDMTIATCDCIHSIGRGYCKSITYDLLIKQIRNNKV